MTNKLLLRLSTSSSMSCVFVMDPKTVVIWWI